MEIQLINYDSVNLTEEIIGVIEFGNVTIATQGLSPEDVYTKTQTDTLLSAKSNTNHNHNLADLTEKSYNSLTDKPELFDGSYNSLSDVPTEFVPTSHNHSIANITDLQTELDSKQATLINQTNIKSINGTSLLGSGNIVVEGGGGGTTDHAQLTNRDIADQHPISSITGLQTSLNDKADSDSVYDISTTNTLLSTKSDTSHNHSLANLTEKNYSSLSNIPSSFTPSAHTQAISTITDLQITLDGKADISDIPTALSELTKDINFDERYYTETEIDTKLSAKSDTSHNHALNNLTEKSYNSLTDKPTLFSGSYADLSNKPTEFTPSAHTQAISTITDLQTTLDGKINNYTRSAVSTLTIDCSTADIFEVTLTANTSFSLTNVPSNKDKAFEILNNSGAEITITLPTSQFWESQTVKIGAGKIKEFTVRSNGTRQIWHVSAELKNA